MAQVQNYEQAYRLAKAILSDILLYNQEKVKKGIEDDNLFEILNSELEEGRKLFESKVPPEISKDVFNKAIIDVIFKQSGRFNSKIW